MGVRLGLRSDGGWCCAVDEGVAVVRLGVTMMGLMVVMGGRSAGRRCDREGDGRGAVTLGFGSGGGDDGNGVAGSVGDGGGEEWVTMVMTAGLRRRGYARVVKGVRWWVREVAAMGAWVMRGSGRLVLMEWGCVVMEVLLMDGGYGDGGTGLGAVVWSAVVVRTAGGGDKGLVRRFLR
ncbi:hypothetical protein F0562_003623 [Nyssa sinensis]|uniref:Uncharacterized protein n=1 Tax=Nyssa sinensis TaxID=561372 RepID=A0A5J5BWF2_9ASTE|nr:hypothetical protein F0562_003623 [Nyssa sinensis]